MLPFISLHGIAAPLPLAHVDTDKILAGKFLTTVTRQGLGEALFDSLRRDPDGRPRTDFILNRPPFDQAVFLIALENFGCGSSREHAPWALLDFGIRCVIAQSFADIFAINCSKNGILPISLSRDEIDRLLTLASDPTTACFDVDLPTQMLTAGREVISFEIDPAAKRRLLEGLDEVALSLQHRSAIDAFELTRTSSAHLFPPIPVPFIIDR